MKKILALTIAFIFITMTFLGVSTFATETQYDGDFRFTVRNGNATLTRYVGSDSAVAIPYTLGGYPVTSIARGAFSDNTALTSINIPNSVEFIADHAFGGTKALTTIIFNNPNIHFRVRSEIIYTVGGDRSGSIFAKYPTLFHSAFHNTPNLTRIYGWSNSTASQLIFPQGRNGVILREFISIDTIPDEYRDLILSWNAEILRHEIGWGHEQWGYYYSMNDLAGMSYHSERLEILEDMLWSRELWSYYNAIRYLAGANYHAERLAKLNAILR